MRCVDGNGRTDGEPDDRDYQTGDGDNTVGGGDAVGLCARRHFAVAYARHGAIGRWGPAGYLPASGPERPVSIDGVVPQIREIRDEGSFRYLLHVGDTFRCGWSSETRGDYFVEARVVEVEIDENDGQDLVLLMHCEVVREHVAEGLVS